MTQGAARGAAPGTAAGRRGLFVPHKFLRTETFIRGVVGLARDAGVQILYPNVLRYSRALFKGKTPHYTYKADGEEQVLADEYGMLLEHVRSANATLRSEAKIKVIPWVEQVITARNNHTENLLDGAAYDPLFLPSNVVQPVLDVEHRPTYDKILAQLVELALYDKGADAIHVDDHLSYPPGKVPSTHRGHYEKKMTKFAHTLIKEFKKATGKLFEISTQPLGYSIESMQARWSKWEADRVIIQLYLPSAAAIIGPGGGDTNSAAYLTNYRADGAKVTGIGVACTGNWPGSPSHVSDDDLIKVMKFEARANRLCVVWHSGELKLRPSLIHRMGALSRGSG